MKAITIRGHPFCTEGYKGVKRVAYANLLFSYVIIFAYRTGGWVLNQKCVRRGSSAMRMPMYCCQWRHICAYMVGRWVWYSEICAYVLNGWPLSLCYAAHLLSIGELRFLHVLRNQEMWYMWEISASSLSLIWKLLDGRLDFYPRRMTYLLFAHGLLFSCLAIQAKYAGISILHINTQVWHLAAIWFYHYEVVNSVVNIKPHIFVCSKHYQCIITLDIICQRAEWRSGSVLGP